jgi:Family of unknown function (DUF5681)
MPDDPITDDLPPQDEPKRRKGFQPGKSGNPAGPKPGQRHPAFAALDAIGQEGAEAVIRKVVEQAIEGDMRAAEILLRRSWPERKGRPLQFRLPPMATAADLVKAAAAISEAMSTGIITPDEAQVAAAVIEIQRKTLEMNEFATRLAEVERQQGKTI